MVITKKYKNVSYEIIIDDEDYQLFQTFKVYLIKQGKSKLRVYCQNKKDYLHRLLLNCPKGMSVDHIDGNPLNNQRSNLRICTLYENTRNTSKKGKTPTSIYKGVCLDSWAVSKNLKKKWIARIKIDYKGINLGRFLTEKEAAEAYNAAALKFWGKYANLNVIKD